MRRTIVVALIAAVAIASGVVIGVKLTADEDASSAATTGLPTAVEETRTALVEAAESGDYEALRPFVADLEYTFGEPVRGGPLAYWQDAERTTGEHPLGTLAAILKMPYVISHGYYVWPFAYAAASADDLSPAQLELLAPLGPISQHFPEGIGYLGWRAGIAPDGTWAFYVAGD